MRNLPTETLVPAAAEANERWIQRALLQRETGLGHPFKTGGETVGVLGAHRLQRAQQNEVQSALQELDFARHSSEPRRDNAIELLVCQVEALSVWCDDVKGAMAHSAITHGRERTI